MKKDSGYCGWYFGIAMTEGFENKMQDMCNLGKEYLYSSVGLYLTGNKFIT